MIEHSSAIGLTNSGKERWPTVREDHVQLEQAPLPYRLRLARDTAFPSLHVQSTLWSSIRLRIEPERMVFAPLLAGCGQPRSTGHVW